MAQEITVNLPTITYTKGAITINITPIPSPLKVDVAGENSMHDVMTLSTTSVSLSKGNITTIGYVYLRNLDSTNNVLVSHDAATFSLLLKPGEYAFFRWNISGMFVKSSAGAPILEYCFIEA